MTESHDPQLEDLLRTQGRGSFGPGFADRVMRRIEDEPNGWLDGLAPAAFARIAAVAVIVADGTRRVQPGGVGWLADRTRGDAGPGARDRGLRV